MPVTERIVNALKEEKTRLYNSWFCNMKYKQTVSSVAQDKSLSAS